MRITKKAKIIFWFNSLMPFIRLAIMIWILMKLSACVSVTKYAAVHRQALDMAAGLTICERENEELRKALLEYTYIETQEPADEKRK